MGDNSCFQSYIQRSAQKKECFRKILSDNGYFSSKFVSEELEKKFRVVVLGKQVTRCHGS